MAMSMRPPQALEGAGAIGEDFPIVCDPCLGGNPYIRMLKGTMGKECRISGRPFNSFRWQGAHNKWKETVPLTLTLTLALTLTLTLTLLVALTLTLALTR